MTSRLGEYDPAALSLRGSQTAVEEAELWRIINSVRPDIGARRRERIKRLHSDSLAELQKQSRTYGDKTFDVPKLNIPERTPKQKKRSPRTRTPKH